MSRMKGPGIFLAQFAGSKPPFDTLDNLGRWAAGLGYVGVQVPTWDPKLFNLRLAAQSRDYCDEVKGTLAQHGVEITELSTHMQGQLMAAHPAYQPMFAKFAPVEVRDAPASWSAWATRELTYAAKASGHLDLAAHATFSGALLWHTMYPWPQRPPGLVQDGFRELANRWKPVLDEFAEHGVTVCFELHPGEDLHDGITFELFLKATGNHVAAGILYDPSHFLLQQLDYVQFIDHYHERIRTFHVKDAEFRPNGKSGVYGGYQGWRDRPGRFRSPGDGQIDFTQIFSKLARYGYTGWAVLEWECCFKHPEDGAREGAPFIRDHIIRLTDRAFDDFAGAHPDQALNRHILGLD